MGAIKRVSDIVNVPVINGGEGSHEHPTQTLYDLHTIYKRFQRLDITIGFFGDLKFARTNHSLIKAASRFSANFIFISPQALQMAEVYINEAKGHGSDVIITDDIATIPVRLCHPPTILVRLRNPATTPTRINKDTLELMQAERLNTRWNILDASWD